MYSTKIKRDMTQFGGLRFLDKGDPVQTMWSDPALTPSPGSPFPPPEQLSLLSSVVVVKDICYACH